MKFLLYSSTDQHNVTARLGSADYSYFFLLRAFAPLLQDCGEVIVLDDLEEADAIHRACLENEEACVLLSFMPPHKTPLSLSCPVIPVFAWEYPEIPERIEEACWEGDPRNDWRHVFHCTGRAITLSSHTVMAVRRSMGSRFPIVAIPAPVIIRTGSLKLRVPVPAEGALLQITASVVDSHRLGLDADGLIDAEGEDEEGTWFEAADATALPDPVLPSSPEADVDESNLSLQVATEDDHLAPVNCGWDLPPVLPIRTWLHGVVYTTVLAPAAGRKNWEDLIIGFCWLFRANPDATLVLKLTGHDLLRSHHHLVMLLSKLSPFTCRVIAINGYLSDADYAAVVDATTYYVNTSLSEGMCLPLVEFLAQGIPALAPDNTAMADYIDDKLAFVIASYPGEPTVWPHGDHEINRTTYHQLDWQSLSRAYRESYLVARERPAQYQRMADAARAAMEDYCGPAITSRRLHDFFFSSLADPHGPVAGDIGGVAK